MQHFKYVYSLLIVFVIISCSDENDNSLPQITSSNLEINENPSVDDVVGIVQAIDNDGDPIEFKLVPDDPTLFESDLEFKINSASGEVKVRKPENIDFETAAIRYITVSMSDGQGITQQVVPIEIIDVEDGPLTNQEKDFLDYFTYVTFWEDPSVQTINNIRKKTQNIRLYLFGNKVDSPFLGQINQIVNELNALIASQGINISYVETLSQANLAFFYGEPAEIQDMWPDMYEDMMSPNLGRAYLNGNPDRIYILPDIALTRRYNTSLHEFLHILGLGHSNDCGGSNMGATENGFNCYSNDTVPTSFYQKDQDVIDYLYLPTFTNNDTRSSARSKLTNILENE